MNKVTPFLEMLSTRPFDATLDMSSRKPWQSLEKHLALIQFTNLYLSGALHRRRRESRFSGLLRRHR